MAEPTLAVALAEVALRAAAAPDLDALRVRTLWNLAAADGRQALTGPVDAVFSAPDDASWTFRTAARMHARTQDDFYPAGRVHVGAVVLPAVLAVGAEDVPAALAAGYAVLCVVSAAYSASAQTRGLRPSGVFGPIGAAAAAAVGLGGDRAVVATAIASAAALSGGTNQAWPDGSEEWMLQVGGASRTGVESARLAVHGFRAAAHAVEGAKGWAAAFFGDLDATLLRREIEVDHPASDVAIKRYPVSGIAQVPTHLAVEAHRANPDRPPVGTVLRVAPAELGYPGSNNRGPFASRSDSLMSLARCVARGAAHGGIDFDAFEKPPDEIEQAWLEQVRVEGDDSLRDGRAVLHVGSDEPRWGSDDVILHPSWADTVSSLDDVAVATESTSDRVREAVALLAGVPRAASLRDFLDRDGGQHD